MKNENAGPVFKTDEEFQGTNNRASNQGKGPPQHRVLCDYTCHTPRKPALAVFTCDIYLDNECKVLGVMPGTYRAPSMH